VGHARNANVRPARADCQATHANVAQGVGTVVNRDHTLHAPTLDVQVTRTKLGRVIKPADSFEPPVYAKGVFVAVELKVTNTGTSPLDGLDETELEIGGKYYSQDFNATFDLDSMDTFPIQPGDTRNDRARVRRAPECGRQRARAGEIVVPDSSDDTVDFSTHLYTIRLAEPTAESGQGKVSSPAPAPAPAPSPAPAPAPAGGASSV
jgi:hypothetical protein